MARIVAPQSEEAEKANRLLEEKYGFMKREIEPVVGLFHGKAVTVGIQPETTSGETGGEARARR